MCEPTVHAGRSRRSTLAQQPVRVERVDVQKVDTACNREGNMPHGTCNMQTHSGRQGQVLAYALPSLQGPLRRLHGQGRDLNDRGPGFLSGGQLSSVTIRVSPALPKVIFQLGTPQLHSSRDRCSDRLIRALHSRFLPAKRCEEWRCVCPVSLSVWALRKARGRGVRFEARFCPKAQQFNLLAPVPQVIRPAQPTPSAPEGELRCLSPTGSCCPRARRPCWLLHAGPAACAVDRRRTAAALWTTRAVGHSHCDGTGALKQSSNTLGTPEGLEAQCGSLCTPGTTRCS